MFLRKYNSCPSPHNLFKLNHKEVLQQTLRTSKAAFEKNLIRSSSTNKICSYIRSISSHKSIPNLIAFDNSVAVSDEDKADSFNRYFHSVFTSHPSQYHLYMNCLSHFLVSVTSLFLKMTSINVLRHFTHERLWASMALDPVY